MNSQGSLLAPVVDYYDRKVREHGPTAKGADWNSADSQELRFTQLLRVCHSLDEISLNDYGCGYGALLRCLEKCGARVTYTGFDISARMLEEARRLQPSARFVDDANALPLADYTVASGIFNVRLDTSDEAWREHVLDTIGRMADRSRIGFSFNMLTAYADADRMQPYLYYADPLFFFDHCKRHISRAVTLAHDYPLFEFTILCRKS